MSPDGTTILFGLPGVRVRHVGWAPAAERVRGDGEVVGVAARRVVQVDTDDPTAAFCPACGVESSVVRQRRTTSPRDLPYGEERLAVRWHKVQYSCREKPCPRKAFTEQIRELPAGARLTGRLRRRVAVAIGEGLAVSVAGEGLMSWPIAHAAFIVHADTLLAEPDPVRVLGIDETRRGRVRWTFCERTCRWVKLERFETNFVDLEGPQGLLGQASGRIKTNVIGWLDARGQDWKDQVQIVAMDPSATYRSAVREALPHALIVADHFYDDILIMPMWGHHESVTRPLRPDLPRESRLAQRVRSRAPSPARSPCSFRSPGAGKPPSADGSGRPRSACSLGRARMYVSAKLRRTKSSAWTPP